MDHTRGPSTRRPRRRWGEALRDDGFTLPRRRGPVALLGAVAGIGDGANVKRPEDAFGRAVAAIGNAGFGDLDPVTTEGRVTAAILMVAGVGLFGTLSGVVAVWFLTPAASQREDELTAVRTELAEIKQTLLVLSKQQGL